MQAPPPAAPRRAPKQNRQHKILQYTHTVSSGEGGRAEGLQGVRERRSKPSTTRVKEAKEGDGGEQKQRTVCLRDEAKGNKRERQQKSKDKVCGATMSFLYLRNKMRNATRPDTSHTQTPQTSSFKEAA